MKFDKFIKDIESDNKIKLAEADKSKFKDEDMILYSLIKGKSSKCLMCDDNTEYIDYCSEAHICSKDCMSALYKMVSDNEKMNEGVEL